MRVICTYLCHDPRDDDEPYWVAYFENDLNAYERGRSAAEAVGHLVMNNPNTFKVSLSPQHCQEHGEHCGMGKAE